MVLAGEMRRRFRSDEPLDDEEAVFAESWDLCGTWLVDEEHGRPRARGAGRFRMLRASIIVPRQPIVHWNEGIRDRVSHVHAVLQPGLPALVPTSLAQHCVRVQPGSGSSGERPPVIRLLKRTRIR